MIGNYVSVLVGPKVVLDAKNSRYDIKIDSFGRRAESNADYCFGNTLYNVVCKSCAIDNLKWDFFIIALAVSAADYAVPRYSTFDGWTRRIELTVAVTQIEAWTTEVLSELESCLMILTGDVWQLHVISGGSLQYSQAKEKYKIDYSCYNSICLLSGGSDSLVGAIDLVSEGKHPLFVSETVRKSGRTRNRIITQLYGNDELEKMLLVSPCIVNVKKGLHREMSTRSRSIRFIAYSVIASSFLSHIKGVIDIHIPENGFISINPPLTTGRIGSLSTKTTYPPYLDGLQKVFDMLNFNVRIVSKYRFMTKGEMFKNCKNKELLNSLLPDAISCGKIGRIKAACGKCVPCLVRRAAEYAYYKDLNFTNRNTLNPNLKFVLESNDQNVNSDLCAMIYALHSLDKKTISQLYGAQLYFTSGEERIEYEDMLKRGFAEIKEYLEVSGIDL